MLAWSHVPGVRLTLIGLLKHPEKKRHGVSQESLSGNKLCSGRHDMSKPQEIKLHHAPCLLMLSWAQRNIVYSHE